MSGENGEVVNPNLRRTAPFMVSGQVTVASGRTAPCDAGAMSQPYRRPFWIDEIRWGIRCAPGVSISQLAMGALIKTKLAIGRATVSYDFIPIHNYGVSFQPNGFVEEAVDATFGSATRVGFSDYRWKLPKPLYVPAGMTLMSSFSRDADGFPDATVNLAYAGRYVDGDDKRPKKIAVPFVSAWQPASGSTNAQSSEKDLVNPYDELLYTQKMIGRAWLYTNANSGVSTSPTFASPLTTSSQIVIKDSYGNNVVRDFLGLTRVFEYNRRAWTFSRILLPRERYNATAQTITTNVRICVSLIGTRYLTEL